VHATRSGELTWRNDDAQGNWVRFDPDDPSVLIIGTVQGELRGCDVRAVEQPLWVSPVHLKAKVDFIAFSPDARWLAWGGDDARVLMWERSSDKTLALDTGASHVSSIIWGESGVLLVGTGVSDSSTNSGQIQIWDAARGERTGVIQAHPGSIHSLGLHPTQSVVASASADTTVKLWDWRRRREIASLDGHQTTVFALAWSPGGEVLVSGDSGGNLRVWDLASEKPLFATHLKKHVTYCITFSPDGKALITGHERPDPVVKVTPIAGK